MFLIILSVIALVAGAIYAIHYLGKKKDERNHQRHVDENVEKQISWGLDEVKIKLLATHSDKQKIARMVSDRIKEYLRMAVHPMQLSRVFENLGLYTHRRDEWTEKEIELSALIKQYVLQYIDRHDLEVWNAEVCADKKPGYERINKSFLVKAEDNMLVWSPNFN